MGLTKDINQEIFEQKYSNRVTINLDDTESIDHEYQYHLFFDRLIQVSELALIKKCNTQENIEYLAKKIVYLHNHKNLILESDHYLFINKVKKQVNKQLELLDYPRVARNPFQTIAFKLIIFCQNLDRNNENDITSLADYIINVRTKIFFDEDYKPSQKRLFAKLRLQYNYYLNMSE